MVASNGNKDFIYRDVQLIQNLILKIETIIISYNIIKTGMRSVWV